MPVGYRGKKLLAHMRPIAKLQRLSLAHQLVRQRHRVSLRLSGFQ